MSSERLNQSGPVRSPLSPQGENIQHSASHCEINITYHTNQIGKFKAAGGEAEWRSRTAAADDGNNWEEGSRGRS